LREKRSHGKTGGEGSVLRDSGGIPEGRGRATNWGKKEGPGKTDNRGILQKSNVKKKTERIRAEKKKKVCGH